MVTSIIPGAADSVFVLQIIELMALEILLDLWAEMKAEDLLRPDAPKP